MVKTVSDVRCGSFPVACGRFAPEGFDADVEVDDGRNRARSTSASTMPLHRWHRGFSALTRC